MNLQQASVQVFLVAPDGEHPFGRFTLQNGQVSGEGQRGISYHGTYTQSGDGVDVQLTASIPANTHIGPELQTLEASTRTLSFHLNPQQLQGQQTRNIQLTGLGSANVRFVID